ncbi:hypothetical protein GEMRC1_001063 [Eukaryota sp. GEM-RC1]
MWDIPPLITLICFQCEKGGKPRCNQQDGKNRKTECPFSIRVTKTAEGWCVWLIKMFVTNTILTPACPPVEVSGVTSKKSIKKLSKLFYVLIANRKLYLIDRSN